MTEKINNIKNKILIEAYHDVLNDTKLIKLATLTTIFHSLVFTIYIIYQIIFIFTQLKHQWSEDLIKIILHYFKSITSSEYFFIFSIIIAIILAIWYFLLPPIAEGALIEYLNSKSIWKAIKKWLKKFFEMFEFHSLISVFCFLAFIIVASRLLVLGVLTNPIIILIIIFRLVIIILQTIFLVYTKFLIILEDLPLKEAIKKSFNLALDNLEITIKFVIVNYILYIRFIINLLIIIWIPIFLIWIPSLFIKNIQNNQIFKNLFFISIIIWILVATYINWIIEAFFISYWYKVYEYIKNKNNK